MIALLKFLLKLAGIAWVFYTDWTWKSQCLKSDLGALIGFIDLHLPDYLGL